ncbi:MAG: tetratricopeptide repeat protein [Desulfobacteraceae bacterium]|jgi:tetratricopeptide (TPR) repeat protein/DNA-binding transcriptional MerR regulator
MPDASTNSYTLSEVAQIVGVDEKTLHLYAHKGLLDPALLADNTIRFTDVDCARLAVIKRANELGYESEYIFNLIGSPDEVINVADPVAACQQFARDKYKQILNELKDCEPLEQLNKKCDLKLLKNYISILEGPKEGPPNSVQRSNAASQAEPEVATQPEVMTQPVKQPSSSDPQKNAVQKPRVLSYSVDKLWDYVKKDNLPLTDDAPGQSHPKDESQNETLPDDSLDDTILSDVSKQGFTGPRPFNRLMKSPLWRTGHEEYKKILTKPIWRSWIFSGLVLALAITGLVKIFRPAHETPQQQITAEAQAPGQRTVQDPAPTPDNEQPTDPVPAPETFADQDAAKGGPDKAASTTPEQTAEKEKLSTDKPSEPTVAAGEKPETQLPAPVQIKNLSLWHDNLNNIYRAELTIQKNEGVMGKEPITGYAFVHLATNGQEAANSKGLLLPQGELESGLPSQIRRGARFSIKNLIQMRIKGFSELPPNDVSSGKVLVYSAEGILLLEQAFNVPIQPFFTAAEEQEPPQPKPVEKKSAEATVAGGISETTIVDSEIAPPPTAPITQPETITSAPETTKEADAPSIAGAEVASSEQIQPQPPVVAPRAAEKVKPIGKLTKTDNPDAAIWEQRSYEAAVRGDFDIAITDATKAIELDPGRVNPYINRSWAYIEKNMLAHAIRDCKAALQIDPENMLAYNNRGLAYQRMAQFPQAREDYRKACDLGLELGCQNLDSLNNQARILELINQSQTAFRNKNWDGVIRATTQVIDLDPQNAVAFTNRSAAYAQKSYLVKALKDSNVAIKHDPNFPLAYNNRGYVYELLGNTRKAAADYLKSCSLGLNLGCKNFDKLN